uniref:Uncharacterized protein n=1 Tax=Anguilla anguilla TaxID=7936 RepID=A0A0E9VME3_ANGAN
MLELQLFIKTHPLLGHKDSQSGKLGAPRTTWLDIKITIL